MNTIRLNTIRSNLIRLNTIEETETIKKTETQHFQHLQFTAIEDMTVSFSLNDLEYSLDGKSWDTLPADTNTPTIKANESVYFRANDLIPVETYGIGTFKTSGKYNVSGNVMSLIYGDNAQDKSSIPFDYCFMRLFRESMVVDASKLVLPAMTLMKQCYMNMFARCNYIKIPPILPATTLAEECYKQMFADSKLPVAPALPAMNLAKGCYFSMFTNSSITTAPALPATTLAVDCYRGMFNGATALVNAPDLPALELQPYCYDRMFKNTKITSLKALFLTQPSAENCAYWFENAPAGGVFLRNKEATWTFQTGIANGYVPWPIIPV